MKIFNFETKELDYKYEEYRKESQLKQIYIIAIFTASMYFTMVAFELFIKPVENSQMVILLHSLVTFILILISFIAYYKINYSLMIKTLMIAPFIASLINTYVVIYSHGGALFISEVYLIVFWVFTASGLNLKDAMLTALAIVFQSIVINYYVGVLDDNALFMHIFWLFSAFTLSFMSAFLLHSSNKTIFLQHLQLIQEVKNKNILLQELSHRVKNNLQIVSSILNKHSTKVNDQDSKEVFLHSIRTIRSIGMIHEKLYLSEDIESVNFSEYMNSLIEYIKYSLNSSNVEFNVKCVNIHISLKSAVPLGLIVNEILTNSIKYAFNNRSSKKAIINIEIEKISEHIYLKIRDNGVGITFDRLEKNFGFKLIESLTTFQLKGELDYFNDEGLNYVISFEDN
ncbi:MAG: sensor histidine kinase [Helicobacteraceae bacterium]|nr:sensor histidine kinase [Helicobacteraceae bacterium]